MIVVAVKESIVIESPQCLKPILLHNEWSPIDTVADNKVVLCNLVPAYGATARAQAHSRSAVISTDSNYILEGFEWSKQVTQPTTIWQEHIHL